MTTITNPSFESSPFNSSWGDASNSQGMSYTESNFQGVTDGSNAMNIALDARSRTSGAYAYIRQAIAFDGDSLLTFDYYDSATSVFAIAILVQGVIYKEIQLGSWGQHSDVQVILNVGSGYKTLEIGLLLKSDSSSGADVTVDNLRIESWPPPHAYVKASGGSDSNDGSSWADVDAWATIDKAATTVADGTTVHIGFGSYSQTNAQDIAPVNAGSTGIKYIPETAVTGGGTGEVVITLTTS